MNFTAEINVMPLKELLDPQGRAVLKNIKNVGVSGMSDVRIGKHITLTLEAASEEEAKEKVETACKKLLTNPVIEYYEYSIKETEMA